MFEASITTSVLSNRGGKFQIFVCIWLVAFVGTAFRDYSDISELTI